MVESSGGLLSHVGIAVDNLDEAISTYRVLTGVEPKVVEVADQKVRVAMFRNGNDHGGAIELLAATAADSPIAKYLRRRGPGLHHICVFVDDIEARLQQLKDEGIRLIDEQPRVGADGHRIAFVHPAGSHGVLLELEERPSD